MFPRYLYYNKFVVRKDNESQQANIFSLSCIQKVVIHISFKQVNFNRYKFLIGSFVLLEIITGQKPYFCVSKKDNSINKVRKKEVTSLCVTLRGTRIYSFIERLIFNVFPKIRNNVPFSFISTVNLSSYTFHVPSFFLFYEIEKEFNFFWSFLNKKIPSISVSFVFDKKMSSNKKINYLRNFQFPLH